MRGSAVAPVSEARATGGRGQSRWRQGVVRAVGGATLLLVTAVAGQLSGQEPEVGGLGGLSVVVRDAGSGAPLPGATVRLRGQDRVGVTGAEGRLDLHALIPRPYTLHVERLGYMPRELEVEVEAGVSAEVGIDLVRSPIEMPGLVVTATGRERGLGEVYRPTTSLSGLELQRALSSSVPATLRSVPGFAMQYNGPAAARPTIRGMGGDRVLVLEDGHRTGDLYQTASDHGVMVEPLSAERMEVVRGPAGLLYGSNALGGVVNVIRNDVPRYRPAFLEGTFRTQLESVNAGVAGGVGVTGPLGPLAYRVEGTARRAGDSRTPLGDLPRTQLTALNASVGASWVGDGGFAGLAVRRYEGGYGVPGEFAGELIPGGHPGGVDIDVARTSARFRGAFRRPVLGFFSSLEADAHLTHYLHDEIEGLIGGEVALGARFEQRSMGANLTAHHEHRLHDHPDGTLRAEGAVGFSFDRRELGAGGAQPGARSGVEWAAAVFAYEEFSRGPLRVQLGGRYDHRHVFPTSTDSIVVRTEARRVAKPVTARTFHALSGSLAVLRDLGEEWTVGVGVARAFRTPTLEELYSGGPHLADFSYDIGSPDIDPETGLGMDLFVRGHRPDLAMEVAVFVNRVSGYIGYRPTGETIRVFREGVPPRETPVFEARAEDALFAGAEGRVQWVVAGDLVLDATASWTRAERRPDRDPLPFIPPLSGQVELRFEGDRLFASLGSDWAAAQRRVPAPIEVGTSLERPQEPTRGHALWKGGIGYRHTSGSLHHTLSLETRNLTDRAWRDHLSRIKDIAPQPGRNVQLTYRVHF